ncbi:MAG: LysM peptidoglycan-binding domain-containing protein [Chloroflexota bacterium]
MTKRFFQLMIVAAILVTSFAPSSGASAWSTCASTITVQWGDTLSSIAVTCGTTVAAIQAANPGLGFWVYAGQVLYIPTGYTSPPVSYPSYGTYVVQWGDTLAKIAARTGVSLSSMIAVNPQIWNPSLIYAGQVINLPGGILVPPPYNPPPPPKPCNCPPSPVDSLSTLKIDYKHGMYIRSEPGGKILASALNKDTVYYYPNSVFMDGNWKVWVKVKVYPPTKGYYEGWLLVKDQLGNYFTNPQID